MEIAHSYLVMMMKAIIHTSPILGKYLYANSKGGHFKKATIIRQKGYKREKPSEC